MGPWAYKFADFLSETKQSYWQILPLSPTDLGYGNSPYHSASAFAYNSLLISPELFVRDGYLVHEDLKSAQTLPNEYVDYHLTSSFKKILFQKAFERFKSRDKNQEYEQFHEQNNYWIEDFSLFMALKSHFNGQPWCEWPQEIKDRQPNTLRSVKESLRDLVLKETFLQYLFYKQWASLKHYCNEKGIAIIGDMPIYVVFDSADVWVHPEIFNLGSDKRPNTVAGVPPDYFSETGQLWGNPVYRWEVLKERGYDWWTQRMAHNLKLFDYIRVDHFRGFLAYWEVPAKEKTAIHGRWVEAPAMDFFHRMTDTFPHIPIIAEDLGTITPDVWDLMNHFKFPGMKVLLFAFGEDISRNPYAPHNHIQHCLVYTGTHDNNTIKGWYRHEATPEDKKRLFRYIGREVPEEELHWELIRLAMMSVSNTAILPMQDILGLEEKNRMNRPSTKEGNWQWRLIPEQLTPSIAQKLLEMTEIYGRK